MGSEMNRRTFFQAAAAAVGAMFVKQSAPERVRIGSLKGSGDFGFVAGNNLQSGWLTASNGDMLWARGKLHTLGGSVRLSADQVLEGDWMLPEDWRERYGVEVVTNQAAEFDFYDAWL